jgi:hypothetical protein
MCIKPLQARASTMWAYFGPKDKSRVSDQDLHTSELKKLARRLTKLTKEDEIPSSCCVDPFDATKPPSAKSSSLCLNFVVAICFHLPFF